VRDADQDVQRKPAKRKRNAGSESEAQNEDEDGGRRTTRSKARRIVASRYSPQEVIELDDSDAGSTFQPDEVPTAEDGLVECLLGCGKRMKVEAMEPHLDKCEDEKREVKRKAPPMTQVRPPANSSFRTNNSSSSNQPQPRPQDRINELHYSSMKDSQFSKKLKDLGIPSWGGKQLMINRHREWVNIWNANCDSATPRSQRELLKDLDTWERTQGGRAPMPSALSSNVMRKDFDGAAYSKNHQDEFSKLIQEARRKQSPAAADEQLDASKQTNGNDAGRNSDETSVPSLDGANDRDQHQAKQDIDPQPRSAQPAPSNPVPLATGATVHSSSIINSDFTISNPDTRTGDETRIPPSHNIALSDTFLKNETRKSQEITSSRTREPMFAGGGGGNEHVSQS
jgi:E3 ubiquitin-protein ligase RAD18